MNIITGDKVMMVKGMERLNLIGEVFEVANITPDNNIILRDRKTKMAMCAIDVDHFDKHFIKAEDARKWTKWNAIRSEEDEVLAYYKTNGKKVIVKMPDGVNAMASCNEKHGEVFNLSTGIFLAYMRCRQKIERKKMKEAESNLVDLKNQINRFLGGLE